MLKNELITYTGGYNEKGEYFNYPSLKEVYDFFYVHKQIEILIEARKNFIKNLNIYYPSSKFENRLNMKKEWFKKHYQINDFDMIFNDLNVNEAVSILEDKMK